MTLINYLSNHYESLSCGLFFSLDFIAFAWATSVETKIFEILII